MLAMDIAALVFASIVVFFVGFHRGTTVRRRAEEEANSKMLSQMEEAREKQAVENEREERERWEQWIQEWTWDQEEKAEKQRRAKLTPLDREIDDHVYMETSMGEFRRSDATT